FASTCYSQYTATADIYTLSLHDALPILVEVGVNVPNATIMVIYDAERFGLSQLHQLRGRVGRGDKQSYCILIADPKSETGKERMRIIAETNDGFRLAERSEEHTSELQSRENLVCRLLLEKKK